MYIGNKLIKKTESVVGSKLVTLEEVAEDRMPAKLLSNMDNASHPLEKTLEKQDKELQRQSHAVGCSSAGRAGQVEVGR